MNMWLVHCAVFRLVLGLVTAYELSCPDQSQRRFLQQNCSSSTPYYTCLFNVIDKRKESECVPRDYLVKKGLKKVRKPGITDANCTEDRYQPTTFYASQLSECMYLKSGCEEEGQVVVSNGTGSQDRSCRCDYRAGYTYVIPPRNPCACVPSEEDCSCRKMYCNQNEALSADYKCEETGDLFLTVCKSISTPTAPPGDTGIVHDQLDSLLLSNTPSHISGSQASLGVLLLLLVVIMVVALLWLRVCPEVHSYIVNFEIPNHVVQRDDVNHKYTVINGCDLKLTLTYKSLLPIRHIMIREVRSGRILKGEEVRGEIKGRYRLRGVKETSYDVSTLQTTSTGTYDIIIINMIGFPSSLMDWWNRCHARLVNFIYNRIDKAKTSTNKTELIIVSLPEMYTSKDTLRGQVVTLELKESKYSLVSWLRLDNEDQIFVVKNDRTQPDKRQKYTGGIKSNPSLTVNQTCMGDGGRYCCFVMATEGEITCNGWKLRVIPQEHGYKEMKYHRSDTEYVRISVVSTASDCLERNGVVVIKGREGTGKTKLALDLASMWEGKGYLPVIVTSEEDITEEFDESNILYIFDHSNSNEKYWIDKLKLCLLQKQSDSTCKAVFMIRNFMFRPLKELKIKENVVVDLDNGLSEDDKQNILTLYIRKSDVDIDIVSSEESNFNQKEIIENTSVSVKLDHDSVRMIIKTEPILGFPLMAKQFCASRRNLHLGEKYFNNPPESIVKKIKTEVKSEAEKVSAGLNEVLKILVLAYITFSGDQNLNMKDIVYRFFLDAKKVLFGNENEKQKLPTTLDANTKEAIQKAADSLVGDYLTCSDGVYEFIHPYYAKAVVLSSDDFVSLIVSSGRLELALEYVRGNRGQGNDVILLAEKYYPNMCEWLIKEFFLYSALTEKTSKIGEYIYVYWVKDRNGRFCNQLLDELGRKKEADKQILPLQVFSLLRYMTSNWNDLWIYTSKVLHDILIIFGLLSLYQVKSDNWILSEGKMKNTSNVQVHPDATRNEEVNDNKQSLFYILLTKLKERQETMEPKGKDILPRPTGIPLDQHGNNFYHYLILLNEELACFIINTCSKYDKKEWTTLNKYGNRPIDLAVALGRPKHCKAFIEAYETYYSAKGRLGKNVTKEEWMKKKKERLKSILNYVQLGDSKSSAKKDKKDDTVINLNENFHPELIRLVLLGSKEDYKALSDILYKL